MQWLRSSAILLCINTIFVSHMHYALRKLKNTTKGKGVSLDITSHTTQKKSVMPDICLQGFWALLALSLLREGSFASFNIKVLPCYEKTWSNLIGRKGSKITSKSYDSIWKQRESLVSGEKTTPFRSGMNYKMTCKWWFLTHTDSTICHFPFNELLIAEEYFHSNYVLISPSFLLLYSDSLMALCCGTTLHKVQHSKIQNVKRCSHIFKLTVSRHHTDIP